MLKRDDSIVESGWFGIQCNCGNFGAMLFKGSIESFAEMVIFDEVKRG